MLDNETFNQLLTYCGGFTDNAYRGAVTVARECRYRKKDRRCFRSSYDSFTVHGSDQYIVGKLQDEFQNRIVISGSW